MSIFHRGKKKNTKATPTITTEEMEDLPYAGEFDLPREEEKLKAVYQHERAGGNFDIRKVFDSKGTGAKTIAKIGHFPGYDEVAEIVEVQFGGGTYNIHPSGTARILKTYSVDGPPRFKPGGTQLEKSHVQELKASLQAKLLSYAIERLEDDPELQRIAALGMLKKYLGVELPAEVDWKEQLFREGVEGNPEFKGALIKAELGKRGAEFPEELDPIEAQIRKSEQFERLRETLDSGKKPPSLMMELILVLPEVLKIIQQFQGIDMTKSNAQAGPSLAAPIETQEGSGSGLGHVSPEVVPPPAGLASGPLETPPPPTPPDPETRPGDDSPEEPLLSKLDWAELEKGVHGDPGEFIGGVWLSASVQDSQYHRQLARLFQNNEPDVILADLSRLAESMAVAEGEDYEVAVSVVNHLRQTEAGRMWLDKAHVAAEVIPALIDQHSVGGVESAENEESDGSGLVGGEDFDGPLLV